MSEIKNHWKKWIYWFMLGVAIIVVYKALDNFGNIMGEVGKFFDILGPFLVGILISYLLYIPCKKTEEVYTNSKNKLIRKKARTLSIITVYIIVVLLIMILINFILPVVIESITELFNNLQWYVDTAIHKYNALPEDSMLKGEIVQELITNVQNINLKKYLNLDNILGYLMGAINAVTSVFNIFVAVIVSIYILSERTQIIKSLKKFVSAMFKDKTYKNIDKYFNNSNEIFFKFVASQFLDAVVVGFLTTIAMTIMKIKFAPLLGFMIGLFNMIPYIGAIIALVIAGLITLITGGLSQVIWMFIVVIILQQIDANIINPKIIGQSLKISPLLVIFAVTVGGAYFGILGMFLAVPVMAVIKIVIEDFVDMKLAEKQKETTR